jgi:hypothetical protein
VYSGRGSTQIHPPDPAATNTPPMAFLWLSTIALAAQTMPDPDSCSSKATFDLGTLMSSR